MKRLLIYFSYIGTNYQGIQRITTEGDVQTIQGVLEYGLKKLFNKQVNLAVSSRTDTGVHAVETTGHIDLDDDILNRKNFLCSPEIICHSLNVFLETSLTDIRVKRVVEVDPEFHCRFHAISRQYCYRIALCKPDEIFDNFASFQKSTASLPISHLYRYHQIIYQPFDVEAVSKACELFVGQWNFRSFMLADRETKVLENDAQKFTKTLSMFTFSKSNVDEVPCVFDPINNKFDFYDFNIRSSGFLKRQVRRMVGSLIAVGQGKLPMERIVHMLKNPVNGLWGHHIPVAPAAGLYLKSVNYKNVPILRGPFS